MTEVNQNVVKQRIYDIITADEALFESISDFRIGEFPEESDADSYPAIYIAGARSPQVSRTDIAASTSRDTLPTQSVVTEYWIIIVANEATPMDTQTKVAELETQVRTILSKNVQLRIPSTEATIDNETAGTDPLAATSVIFSTPRLTATRGKITDGINVMLRTVNHV